MNHKSNMNVGEESDDRVVPAKCPNKDGSSSSAEGAEGRRSTKENSGQTTASQTQSWGNALSGLRRVREAAKKDKRVQLTALLHHVSGPLLLDSFYALKREAAPGVDGMTWKEYETDLDKRLEDLHSRVHRGAYRALPSKRAYIPKRDGRQRPLGIAALEDKIVQHAVGTVLNQIYEEDFLGFSVPPRLERRPFSDAETPCSYPRKAIPPTSRTVAAPVHLRKTLRCKNSPFADAAFGGAAIANRDEIRPCAETDGPIQFGPLPRACIRWVKPSTHVEVGQYRVADAKHPEPTLNLGEGRGRDRFGGRACPE